jgi:hypothetical protein
MPILPNKWSLRRNTARLTVQNRRGESYTFIIDKEDMERVRNFQWMAVVERHRGGAVFARCAATNQRLHHLIYGETKKLVWLDGNHFNCRKVNLSRTYPSKRNPMWRGTANISRRRYSSWFRSARVRRIDWGISIDDIDNQYVQQQGICPLSGRRLTEDQNSPDLMSLDRKDVTKGYSRDNIQLVTTTANYCKRALSDEAFVKVCEEVVKYARKKRRKEHR